MSASTPSATDVRRYGARALLLTPPDGVRPAALAHAVRELRSQGVVEVAPAAGSVLVTFDEATRFDVLRDSVAAVEGASEWAGGGNRATDVVIEVVYDGDDLEAVAAACGLTIDDVIEIHSEAVYTCDFCGFAPGFAYLSGLDDRLQLARRSTPRPSVPAGSVAIAGPYTAIYPTSSPGGWHLLGRIDAGLWDTDADPPALIQPGATVRFRHPRATGRRPSRTQQPSTTRSQGETGDDQIGGRRVLRVIAAGVATTVQDEGRPGFAHLAVSPSGALDGDAAALVNRLVGNQLGAAVIETAGGLVFEALGAVVVADSATGTVRSVTAGDRITVEPAVGEQWAYLALRGGVAAEPVLGSRSRDSLSGLGPPPLEPADVIGAGPDPGTRLLVDQAPHRLVDDLVAVRVWPGPHPEHFGADALNVFTTVRWQLTTSSRVGARLAGPPIVTGAHVAPVTEGLVRGAVQVPPDGQPLVLLADHPTTGGYPVVAVVDEADVGRVAQRPPGSPIRFALIDRPPS